MKVVVNKCYGGFGLSNKAQYEYYCRKYGKENVCCYYMNDWTWTKRTIAEFLEARGFCSSLSLTKRDLGETFDERLYKDTHEKWYESEDYPSVDFLTSSISFRADPVLVSVVEDLGVEANGDFADLQVVEIPDDVDVEITEYDGLESIEEKHRSW